MAEKGSYSITEYFGSNLAALLSKKIEIIDRDFDSNAYIEEIEARCRDKSYTQRIDLHAEVLQKYLPQDFKKAVKILLEILGPENENETGMFKHFYWVLPIGKYVEKYGLENLDLSLSAIEEITKRNTGEYAIRPFIRKYPKRTLRQMMAWALSDNFHLRRLASEGLRPKLPWSKKLDTFVDNPDPVFEILEQLKADSIKFVQKSVANHLTDYLKVNQEPTVALLRSWSKSENNNTQWIIKHATRKFDGFL